MNFCVECRESQEYVILKMEINLRAHEWDMALADCCLLKCGSWSWSSWSWYNRQPGLLMSILGPKHVTTRLTWKKYVFLNTVWTCKPENGDSMFLWDVGIYLKVHMLLQPRRLTLTSLLPSAPHILHLTTFLLNLVTIVIIIIFHHEVRPGWPVSIAAFTSYSSLFIGHPGHCLPFEWCFKSCLGSL
jgi:hypothetical protein